MIPASSQSDASPTRPHLTLSLLPATPSNAFEELLPLYTEAFIAEERKPLSQLRAMLRDPGYRFFLARQDSLPVGLAIVALLPGEPVALLEYMAIRVDLRGQGLGRHLFRQVAAAVLTTDRSIMLIEVESDRHPGPAQQGQHRRKRFYRSFGAREIHSLHWLMPPVSGGLPPPMDLLAFGNLPDRIARPTLQRWLRAIYVAVYRQHSDDPRLASMTEDLPPEVALV